MRLQGPSLCEATVLPETQVGGGMQQQSIESDFPGMEPKFLLFYTTNDKNRVD